MKNPHRLLIGILLVAVGCSMGPRDPYGPQRSLAEVSVYSGDFNAKTVKVFCQGSLLLQIRGLSVGQEASKPIKRPCSGPMYVVVEYLGGLYWTSETLSYSEGVFIFVSIGPRPQFTSIWLQSP